MNNGLIYTAIKNRKVTLFMVIIVLIFGMYSSYIIPKQEDPVIDVSVALITTVYPGASSEVVEHQVTTKIEDVLPEITGYDYSESYSYNGLSIIVLRLDLDADVDKAWQELREKIDYVQDELPSGVHSIDVNTKLADTAGIILSLSGENYSSAQLEDYAEYMKKELSKINGITRFEITGVQEEQVKVEIDSSKLNYYNISLQEIVNILRAQNIEIPAGSITENNSRINVNIPGSYSSLEEIENIIIDVSKETGAVVRLKDIANIQMGYGDSTYKVKRNGNDAILLTGYFEQDKNILLTGKEVQKQLDKLKNDLPKDVSIDEILYQPTDVNNSIKDFMLSLLIGVLIVVTVVFLSMGIRNAVIVSTAIPLSLLITISVMYFLGIELHQISISALIISLGMLVDNAIVISDSIQFRIDKDEEKMAACVNGTKDVAIPVLTSTLTTVFAFIPLLVLPGMAGEFIKSLPQIIIISLSASYLVAIFVSPTMAYLFFKKSKPDTKKHFFRKFFSDLLRLGLRRKKTTLFITFLVFLASLYVATLLGLQFFPKADKDILYININTDSGSNFSKTEAVIEEVEDILADEEEIVNYTTAVGGGLPKFYYSLAPKSRSESASQIMLKIDLDNGGRFSSNSEYATYLQEIFNDNIVGADIFVKELEQGEPIGAPIVIRVTGDDMEELTNTAIAIEDILNNIDGTINVEDDISNETFEYVINIDQDMASSMGITKYDIQNEVNIALKGATATVFRNEGKEHDIVVSSDINSLEELENLAIKSPITGNKVLLKQVADIELKSQLPSIYKYDREKTVTVLSDVKPGYSSVDIEKQVKAELAKLDLDGVSVVFDGEGSKITTYFGGMGEAAIFIAFLIFVILLIQFKSIIQPFIVLLTILLSLIGSIWGLYIFKQPLSFTALLGMVSLMGIVVNNAIVLLDYINNERAKGKSIDEACMEASNRRFRPIMLTTLTTVIGLSPLAFSGSNLFVPMAVAIISGLLISSLFTLIIIPIVYSLVIGNVEKMGKKKQGSKQEQDNTTLASEY